MQTTDPPPASVPPRILSKLALYIPPKELVDAYLGEIAKSYGVPFEVAQPIEALQDDAEPKGKGDDDSGGPGEGQEKEEVKALEPALPAGETSVKKGEDTKKEGGLPDLPATQPEAPPKKVNEDDELAKRFERLKNLR
jgi:vacuolar protein sorting-associated protein IST1